MEVGDLLYVVREEPDGPRGGPYRIKKILPDCKGSHKGVGPTAVVSNFDHSYYVHLCDLTTDGKQLWCESPYGHIGESECVLCGRRQK